MPHAARKSILRNEKGGRKNPQDCEDQSAAATGAVLDEAQFGQRCMSMAARNLAMVLVGIRAGGGRGFMGYSKRHSSHFHR
jgi:hypothetical protein